jgi:hypothetical protein
VFGGFAEPEQLFQARFDEFKERSVINRFSSELAKRRSVELDVSVRNNKQAVDRLKDILRDYNIVLVEDPTARAALNDKARPKMEYLVYAENLMTKLMRELGETFVVPSATGKNEQKVTSPFQKFAVDSLANEEKGQLAKTLGVDPATLEPREAKNGKPDAKRQAILLPTAPGAAPSPELKQFANDRRPPQAGKVQVLIRIHQD